MDEWRRTVIFAALPFLIRALAAFYNDGLSWGIFFRPTEITFFAIMIGAGGLVEAGRFEEESKDGVFNAAEDALWLLTIIAAVNYGFQLPDQTPTQGIGPETRLFIISTFIAVVNIGVAYWVKSTVTTAIAESA
jgi:hypothetical protein